MLPPPLVFDRKEKVIIPGDPGQFFVRRENSCSLRFVPAYRSAEPPVEHGADRVFAFPMWF